MRRVLVTATAGVSVLAIGLAACSDDEPTELPILGAEVLDNGEVQLGVRCADDVRAEEHNEDGALTVTVTGHPKDGECGATVTLSVEASEVESVIDGATGEHVALTLPDTLVPDRQPDVTGVFHLPDPPDEPEGPWVEISAETDPYFRHALLDLSTAVVVGTDGRTIPAASVEDGSQVQVWTGGCHERNPVECAVEALRVLDP